MTRTQNAHSTAAQNARSVGREKRPSDGRKAAKAAEGLAGYDSLFRKPSDKCHYVAAAMRTATKQKAQDA